MFLKSKEKESACEKVHAHVDFTKILQKLKVIALFFWVKSKRFLKQKIERFGPNKTTLFFLTEDKF